jgi:hypothetical protein
MMRRGQTLVATLIVITIMAILAVVLLKGSGAFSSGPAQSSRKDGHGTTVLGAAQYAARDDVCRSNIRQVRDALIIVEASNDDKPPEDIHETKLPKEFYACPIGKEPYVYDSTSGQIHCPHPGHEKY